MVALSLPVQKKNHSGYKVGELVIYPSHGLGQIVAIDVQEIANQKLELFVIDFQKEKMRLKVPVGKVQSIGMRKLSDSLSIDKAFDVLSSKPRVKRVMWSRRAQEYDAKIHSGDLIFVCEVVRDLFRLDTQQGQSYSERQLYQAALDRLVHEVAAVKKISDNEAILLIETNLLKYRKKSSRSDAIKVDCEKAA